MIRRIKKRGAQRKGPDADQLRANLREGQWWAVDHRTGAVIKGTLAEIEEQSHAARTEHT